MKSPDICIIGGGLCGLTASYLLEKSGLASTVIEARDRLGGRIHTLRADGEAPLEMGATWLGKKHRNLLDLLDELDVDINEQFMDDKGFYEPMSISPPQLVNLPPNEEPSYRIKGGSDRIIRTLKDRLDQTHIVTGASVEAVQQDGNKLVVQTDAKEYRADVVISTLPPKLLISTISFDPPLPGRLRETAEHTHTWMGESIKVALTYDEPFWREPGSSGTIFSNVGPINEMYDHSDEESKRYALKGFMNGAFYSVSKQERKELILGQLRRYFGDKADSYISYRETVWKHEPYTYKDYRDHIIPHQHNGDPVFQEPCLDGHLIISGSETAGEFPGYMDGAVESAHTAVKQVEQLYL